MHYELCITNYLSELFERGIFMKNSVLKRICAVSLAVAMLAGAGMTGAAVLQDVSVTASAAMAARENVFTYEVKGYEDKYIRITGYKGTDKDVVIPSEIDGITVDGFEAKAFYGNKTITSVTMPTSVTYIGESAFEGCTALTKAVMPDSIRVIEDNAFKNCGKLTIYAEHNSLPESYAKRNKIPCTYMSFPLTSTPFFLHADGDKETYIGETVTVICDAAGGKREYHSDYQYALYYKRADSTKWTTAQNYSTNDLVSFKPKHTGDYDICLKVKDKAGKIAKTYITKTIYPKFKVKATLTANEIKLGQKVSVNQIFAGAVEGRSEFEVFYKNENQTKWTKATNYENGSVVIKPRHTGKYTVCVRGTYYSVNPDVKPLYSKKYLTLTVTE